MERTPYQDGIIRRYYNNRDSIMWNKLSDMVADLYLAEGKKRIQLWKRIIVALENLNISQARIDHLVGADNPAMLARFIEEHNR